MQVEYLPRSVILNRDSVITVGVFDGVHLGHRTILDRVRQRAESVDGAATVVTFDPHPQEVVSGDAIPLLTTLTERSRLLEEIGIDRVVVISFDESFSRLSPEEFVGQVLLEKVGFREIVIGYDHGFGSGRRGDVDLLKRLSSDLGFAVHEMKAKTNDHTPVSSSAIREILVARGDVEGAADLLGRLYSVSGEVIKGDGRGRVLGYPTANIFLGNRRKLVPHRGVYAVRVRLEGDPAAYDGMMNIGFRPTFDGAGLRLEVHLFEVDMDLYGRHLQTEFVERIRNERRFDGIESLKAQLKEDEARCRRALASVS